MKSSTPRSLPTKADALQALGHAIELHLMEEERYADPDYTASRLVTEMHTYERAAAAAIRHRFGTNYAGLLNRLRIDKAKKMLADARFREVRIEDIAHFAGYKTRQGFHLAFREAAGTSPAEFRRQVFASITQEPTTD